MASSSQHFDPLDPSFGIDLAKYPNSKSANWNHRIEEDGWVLAHNSIRGELEDLKFALGCVIARRKASGPKEWEVAAVQKYWRHHAKHVRSHHGNEDRFFAPLFGERFRFPEQMEIDHQQLVKEMRNVAIKVEELEVGNLKKLKEFYHSVCQYEEIMVPHLEGEERLILPLMMAYFTQEEIADVVGTIINNPEAPREEWGAIIHYASPEYMRNKYMPQEGIPSFAWYLKFLHDHNFYENEVFILIETLVSGAAPGDGYGQYRTRSLAKICLVAATLGIALAVALRYKR